MPAIQDHVAIVTGGSSGIGLACARALAAAGAKVAIVARNPVRLEQARESIAAQPCRHLPLAFALDVRREGDMAEMADRAAQAFGQIDVLIAAAGVGAPSGTTRGLPRATVQLSRAEWDEVVATNLRGTFLSMRAVLPSMMRRRQGTIVNVSSSRGARRGLPLASAYCASKRAMLVLTEAAAEEAAAYGVRVMAILPDATDTPLVSGLERLYPDGLLSPGVVAELILQMIALPPNAVLEHPLVKPLPGRCL